MKATSRASAALVLARFSGANDATGSVLRRHASSRVSVRALATAQRLPCSGGGRALRLTWQSSETAP